MAGSLFKWLGAYILIFSYADPRRNVAESPVKNHPLYVTVTEVNHNTKDKTLEISCKIFTNDFEDAIEKTAHTKVDLSQPKDKNAADKLVNDYIARHLQLQVDGKPVTLQFVGFEKETDATWSYFQVNNITAVKKLDVMNSLLYESFTNEINIMHVNIGGNRESRKLNNPDTRLVFEFSAG